MVPKASVLIVEDSSSLALLYTEYLRSESVDSQVVVTGAEALVALQQTPPQAMILDLHLPDMNGMQLLKYVIDHDLPTSVVVVTGHGSVDVAVDAMRAGAFDFVEKPFSAERLKVTLHNALERQRLAALVDSYKDRQEYNGFIGSAHSMQAVYRIIDNAAASRATIFITGESGTGKEVCAEAIHKQSERREKPFVALNCAAIPKDLMESEIFGHVKGAFTSAHSARQGAAARANGGTLFLDEVCEMDLDLQSKLLRFIQTGTFQQVGGSKLEKVDIRFVCATNRDPLKEVEEGRFREDLYYRLHVIPVHLPPLRERDHDILLIARRLLSQYAKEEGKNFKGFAPETEAVLMAYQWPGNVRQLQNVLRNIVVLNSGEIITVDMLPPPLNSVDALRPALSSATGVSGVAANHDLASEDVDSTEIYPLWQEEKRVIERAISLCDGNIPKAAAQLEISASTIYRKRQQWQSMMEVS